MPNINVLRSELFDAIGNTFSKSDALLITVTVYE